jgi:hypothetical protein
MENKILLIYWPIGPTFKNRILYNLSTFDSYKFFDVLILTDDAPYFKDLNHSNVIIKDINEYIALYPEFHNFEFLPKEKYNSGLYRKEIEHLLFTEGKKLPLNIQRFGLLYENIGNYDAVSILDCDMIPVFTDEEFADFQNYVKNVMPVNSISTNKSYYTFDNERNLELLKKYSIDLNKQITIDYPIQGFDGLFKLYKFESSTKIKEFFDTWNYILLDSYKNNTGLIGGSWNVLIEEILALVYKLLNIRANIESEHYIGVGGIKSFNFPEDRYWDDWTHYGFDISSISQEEYIKTNYDKLKEYYSRQNLKFPY